MHNGHGPVVTVGPGPNTGKRIAAAAGCPVTLALAGAGSVGPGATDTSFDSDTASGQ